MHALASAAKDIHKGLIFRAQAFEVAFVRLYDLNR